MSIVNGLILVVAGLLGASGVAATAASSHAGAAVLGPYALIALTHAPALLTLGLMAQTPALRLAGIGLCAGALLFCGDLAARYLIGAGLFPYSAPMGGVLLIAGWLAVAAGGIVATGSRVSARQKR